MPWARSGIDGKAPSARPPEIHHLCSKIAFTKAAASLVVNSTSPETNESLSTLDEALPIVQRPNPQGPLQTIPTRRCVTGTVIKHLQDDSGATHALFVFVARKVKGILYMTI